MKQHRSTGNGWRSLATSLLATALCWTAGLRAASAAPIKVACIGEHTTHGHAFPAMNRETQPVGMQEYPAQLQAMLGPGYDVRNFGDCCGSVLQGYAVQETHPYVLGANAGDGPGYKESIAFLPDIVIIGSWGRHDWGLNKAAAEVWSLAGFQDGYDDLVKRYQALSSHPKIFVSYPIPILNGQGDVPDQGVTTISVLPAFDAIAKKYDLPIVDLYHPFLNRKELYRQPPDAEGEGEHANPAGLTLIAKTVFAAMQADQDGGGTTDASTGKTDASSGSAGAPGAGGAAGSSGGSSGSGGSGGSEVSTGAAGQGTAGAQGGSADMPAAGGSNAAGAAPAAASSDSGCSCSLASQSSSAGRAAALMLGALALLVTRRQRATIRS